MNSRLQDIAESLGISISQVSRALTNRKGVAAELRRAILLQAEKMGYQNHSGKHKKKIVFVFRDISEEMLPEMNQLWKRIKRKKCTVIGMFPENADFLNQYVFDEMIAFHLPESDLVYLREFCKSKQSFKNIQSVL